MSAPRRLNINPDVALKIEIVPKFDGIDHTDSFHTWRYQITNIDEIFAPRHIPAILKAKANEGLVSPTSRITLSRTIRRIAGIPEDATTYAFLYPPIGLAEVFQSVQTADGVDNSYQLFADSFSFTSGTRPTKAIEQEEAVKAAILLGGFVYFDDDFNCIRVNALSRTPSSAKLNFSGPFNVHVPAYDELKKLGRTQHLRVSNFREAGFESFAWVRPREKLCFKAIFNGYNNPSGALLFFREDRTAIGYAVDSSGYLDPKGNVDIICDALSHIGEAHFTQYMLQPLYDIQPWKNKVEKITDPAKLIEELEDKRTLLHKACQAGLDTDFIAGLLAYNDEISNISYQDYYGWNPLHYACRFSPRNRSLIMLLAKACPPAVLQSDLFNRCPIHIACDSNTSKEVITILLEEDGSSENPSLYRKTKRFGLLPLHLACYGGASHSVIKTLLEADPSGFSCVTKTRCDQLPLHLAILKQLHPSTVKMIIDAVDRVDDDFYQEGYDAGVYDVFESKLPLHLACWNNSSSEIIKMLLDRDRENITTSLGAEPEDDGKRGTLRHFSIDDKPYQWASQTISKIENRSTVALHLALKHGSTKIISLLLQKELEADNYEVTSSSIYKKDSRGRTPLHIACESTPDPRIILLLMNLDKEKQTLQLDDLKGFRPMHYICARAPTSTSTEILYMLSDEEDRIIKRQQVLKTRTEVKTKTKTKEKKRSALCRSDTNKTPLALAIKSNMPKAAIDILMKAENFTLDGLDEENLIAFAEIVKGSKEAQVKTIDMLADRGIFSMILIELYANLIALGAVLGGTLQLFNGSINKIFPILLLCSSGMFILRELLQILSIHLVYFLDGWNWVELTTTFVLFRAAILMLAKIGDPQPDIPMALLCAAGSLIVVQIVSFLRSTFLPFARFYGGLVLIIKQLIPFLIVSVLLICAFLYGFYVTSHPYCETFWGCIQINFQTTFNYGPGLDTYSLDILFGLLIVIILLNVVVAIVGEAWDDAATQSLMFFWKYRVDKIQQYQGLERIKTRYFGNSTTDSGFLQSIDKMENISFQTQVAWSMPPFSAVTTKAHYDIPQDFFDPSLTRKVLEAKSLQADLYFGDIDSKKNNNGVGLSRLAKLHIILKWLGRCLVYLFVIILGIITCGILFPKNFRSGLLSMGIEELEEKEFLVEDSDPLTQDDVVEDMDPIHELEEYITHKRGNLRIAGVPENEIDLAIPATLTRNEARESDYFYKQYYNSGARRIRP